MTGIKGKSLAADAFSQEEKGEVYLSSKKPEPQHVVSSPSSEEVVISKNQNHHHTSSEDTMDTLTEIPITNRRNRKQDQSIRIAVKGVEKRALN